ncbi:AIR synthase [Clostridium novyi B str. ATCC 27606]|uniref:AIR synthase n=2 Tax=Clostridium TaxID=1485 RepID=A0AA40ITE1_CLONO|nr:MULTISPECIES: AIR synthase family protein [Clostridium]KEI12653.1 AIR synthase [Clostridium novyi B str. NCTC 9691]KEI15485.1 AIR synthase [Clostridium novyi B str. ATCC 27606]KEI18325.1 AIR synthase [Clostridium haemolyticum NCTC 9693]KGN03630.1 AIR synthase [Clostridium haemolyticum NCTC 8350]OOB75898.1 AIR synthase [Clostridium haemolyticum]
MQIGKLEWKDLKNIINNNRGVKREDVRIRSGIGEDCSVINFGEYECVVSTDPITGADKNMGKLAVHINCNDIASCGVEPLGILVTILAPANTKLKEIQDIMNEINDESEKLNIEILGGHTEITDAVNKIIVSCTVMGKTNKGKAVSTSGAKIGDDIIVTKHLCLEGSSIIVNDYYERARQILKEDEIKEAKNYVKYISVIKEGKIAGDFGVNSMHDITEGGLLGALWEVAEGSNVGFKIYRKHLPITKVTKKLCNFFKIDPLKFISSGSMIITCKNGEKLVQKLQENNIPAAIVGKITKNEKKLVEIDNDNIDVLPVERDELFKII